MKVILGVDESPFSDGALRYVSETTWPKETSFVVLSAVPPMFFGAGEAVAPQGITDLLEEEQRYHKEVAERGAARLRKAGLKATARAVLGDPRIVLEEAARKERADMVVVGSHGRSGLKKLLLGSVASHVVTHAPCAVLVIKSSSWKPREGDRIGADTETAALPA